MEFVTDAESYAAKRKPQLQQLEDSLVRLVKVALRRQPDKTWADALVNRTEREVRAVYRQHSGKASARGAGLDRELRTLKSRLGDMFKHTEIRPADLDEQARAVAASMAAAIISTGTLAAAHDSEEPDSTLRKVWIDMDDKNVRASHRDVASVGLDESFKVAGVDMDRPGDMRAPIALWINCRCILGVQSLNEDKIAATIRIDPDVSQYRERITTMAPTGVFDDLDLANAEVVDLTGEDDAADAVAADDEDLTVYWHGVLAPEGKVSGDKRRFNVGGLTWRDLPLNLSWQEVNADGHDGSAVIGLIEQIERDEDNLLQASGRFLQTPRANEYIGMRAEGAMPGVSVDVDSATMSFSDADGNELSADELTDDAIMDVSGRISGATLCAIPAFMEARINLGKREAPTEESLVASGECLPCMYAAGIDEGAWDGSAGGYTDQEWYDATIIHLGDGDQKLVKANNKLPIYTPSGKLSRAGVHAAAGRLGQTDAPPEKISAAKATLRGAYDVLDEDPPETIKAATAEILEFGEFGEFVKTEDGPGWLTHPVDTERLRRYWSKGKGALKIRWGVPGDFNRCRMHLAKYIKPEFLNGYCANRHYDALGFWPGRPTAVDTDQVASPALHLVASADLYKPPREWFENPGLVEYSPLSVTEDGRVFGHLAEWGTCHIGFKGECVVAPQSGTNYAYFQTGAVLCADGTEVAVGHLTMDTGHADQYASAAKTVAHYDNTGYVVADIAVGDDEYGIWMAGCIRPGTQPEHVYALRASTVSGDWRTIGRHPLELVAALVVNVPGFPIPRTQLAASGGKQVSLVAAGVVPPVTDEKKDEWAFDIVAFGEAIGVEVIGIMDRRAKMSALTVERNRKRMSVLAQGRN